MLQHVNLFFFFFLATMLNIFFLKLTKCILVDVKLVITKLWPYFNGSEAQEVETLPT